MGLKSSKPKLSKEDLEFLKNNTSFTEEQIKEWYKGFVVSLLFTEQLHGRVENTIMVMDNLRKPYVKFCLKLA